MVLPVLADDATTTTDAKDQKDLKKVIEDQGINYVETAQKGITLSGYVDVRATPTNSLVVVDLSITTRVAPGLAARLPRSASSTPTDNGVQRSTP